MQGYYIGWFGRGVAAYRGMQEVIEVGRAQLRRVKRSKKKDRKRV